MRIVAFVLAAWSLAAQSNEYERARQLLTSGQALKAVEVYRQLARMHPGDASTLLNLSIAQYKAGLFRDGAASAAAALKLSPDLVDAHLFLGANRLELGEFAGAADSLARVIAANPRERNARLMLAEALLGAGKAAAALEHFQAAAEMLPGNTRVLYGLGRAYEATGRKEVAAETWKQLLALPPSLESHMHAAEVHAAGSRWRDAAAEWREALKMAPGKAGVRLGLAWSLFRLRDYGEALAVLQPLLTRAQADPQFLYGASLLNLQQPAEAMPYLKAAIDRDPHLLPARAALGQALLQTGKAEEAIPLLESSLSVDEDGSTHFQLFRAYQLTHQNEKAKQARAGYERLRASLAARP
jgi:tetratricopeptide (TPR) repeat protein